MKYQNVEQTLKQSRFINIDGFAGHEAVFTVARPTTKVGLTEVQFAKGSLTVRKPKAITACGDTANCVVGTVSESVGVNFNVTSVESLDALKVEVDRLFALTKESLVNGLLPPVYSDFATE